MNLENLHYDAFISYRHCEHDMFVAKTLHKYLESFKLPRSVKKAHPELPTKISRVFRDQEELPLVANLGDPITEALSNSDNLIVICTPRLKESLWCQKEIETFISMHGRERVFAVLAEGEPEDSFPEQLLVNEKGEPCEPLAADFRGSSKSEIKKKMKDEGLRLLAPMFSLNFDDLKQRHRERRMHRILAVGAAVMVAVLAFGTYCGITALKIKKQSDEIAMQNEQISAQKEQIEQQYLDSLKKYEISMANTSENLMNEGRRKDAIFAIYSAMPHKKEGGDIPYAPEAEKALADALTVYDTGDSFSPIATYESPSGVAGMYISPSGKRMVMLDESKNVLVWDTASGKLIETLSVGRSSYANQGIALASDSLLFSYDDDGEYMYDLDTKEKIYVAESVGNLVFNKAYDKCMVMSENITLIDIPSKKILFDTPVAADKIAVSVYHGTFMEEKNRFACIVNKGVYLLRGGEYYLQIYDLDTGKMVSEKFLGSEGYYTSMCSHDDMIYISYSLSEDFISYEGYIMGFNTASGEVWRKSLLEGGLMDLRYYEDEKGSYLFGHDTWGPYTLNPVDGDIIYYSGNSFSIVTSVPYDKGKFEMMIGSDGTLVRYVVSSGIARESSMYTHAVSGTIRKAIFKKGVLYLYKQGSDYVTRYNGVANDNVELYTDKLDYDYTAINGRYGLKEEKIDEEYIYRLYNIKDGSLIDEVKSDNYAVSFIDDGSEGFVLYGKSVEVYDIAAKKLNKTYERSEGVYTDYDHLFGYGSVLGGIVVNGDTYYYKTIASETGEDTGITMDITDNHLNYRLYEFAPDARSGMCVDTVGMTLSFYAPNDSKPKKTYELNYGVADKLFYSNDSKYALVFYKSGVSEVYDATTFELVKVIYDDLSSAYSVINIASTGGYLIHANEDVLYDKNFDAVAGLNNVKGYDKENDKLILISPTGMYRASLLSYDDLISKAEKILKEYSPDDRIINKYGIIN